MALCAGCKQLIPNKINLICSLCYENYDLECANITEKQYNSLSNEMKLKWECQECRCKKPKNNNNSTPARPQLCLPRNSTPETFVTVRRKPSQSQHNDTTCSEDTTIFGNTINGETHAEPGLQAQITLQSLSDLISSKLKENNSSIITEIQNTIQKEINLAILKLREDVKKETDSLLKQNQQRKSEIETLNTKIEDLKKETELLQSEIKILSNKTYTTKTTTENNMKKIVLYGLPEIYKESENELDSRILNVFRDILQVDLLGYIEDTHRIGKYKNNTRPLVIELISKRMTKYLVQHNRYFRGTGLHVSEFLDEEALKERHIMRGKMLTARKEGHYAIIKNNQLYIEGEQINCNINSEIHTNNNNISEDPMFHDNKNERSKTFRTNRSTFRDD